MEARGIFGHAPPPPPPPTRFRILAPASRPPPSPTPPGTRVRAPSGHAPLPYVLSWLKLAKSSWPEPASPLWLAKFMAASSLVLRRAGGAQEGRRGSASEAPGPSHHHHHLLRPSPHLPSQRRLVYARLSGRSLCARAPSPPLLSQRPLRPRAGALEGGPRGRLRGGSF